MSFGGADNPFGGVELQPQGSAEPAQPPRPLDEIGAERAADLAAVQAEHGEAIDQEERFAQIGEAVLTLATDGGEGEAHLGPYIEHETFPDGTNCCLYEAECRRRERNPDYDITQEAPQRIARFLERGLQYETEEAAELAAELDESEEAAALVEVAEDRVETAENEVTTTEAYEGLVQRLRAEGKSNVQIIAELANNEAVPDSERAKLQSFNRILNIAAAVPADREIIAARINELDMSQGLPSPASFAQAFIFDTANRSTGVSMATQEAIASELGISLHGVEPPRNASDLQSTLREGRGVERETEIRRVEEPPGSGNFVEKEVVVSERTLPFTEADPVIINLNPRVEAFPIAEGSETHEVKAYVTAGEPSRLEVDIPEHGSLPTTDINNFVVSQQTQALLANHGYAGALNELLGAGDSTTGISPNAVQPTLSQTDPSRVMTQTLLGNDFAADGRFLSQDHLNQMEDNLRSLAVDGDFGAFNRMEPDQATALMRGMLGEGQANVVPNLNRLRDVINSGGAEAPSYQATYAAMYPADAAAGYPRLREIIGGDGLALLGISTDTAV